KRGQIYLPGDRMATICLIGSNKSVPNWWRRRESNPRPEASGERLLHAQPFLDFRPAASRKGKTAAEQPRIDLAGPSGGPDQLHPHFATSAGARRVRYPTNVAT